MRSLLVVLLFGVLPGLRAQRVPVQATEDLRLGARITHLTRPNSGIGVATDGKVVLVDAAKRVLLFFTADGQLIGTVGSDKLGGATAFGGPGWIGDTLWVNNPATHEATLLSTSAKVLRTLSTAVTIDVIPLDASGITGPGVNPRPMALSSDGTLLVAMSVPPGVNVPPSWGRPADGGMAVLRVLTSGVVTNAVGWLPAHNGGCQVVPTPTTSFGLPFCAEPLYAIAPSGDLVAFARARTSGSDSGTTAVTVVGRSGDTLFSRRYPFVATRIPPAIVDSVMQARLASTGSIIPQAAATYRAYHPAIYPPVTTLLVGRDSTIWLEQPMTAAGRPWQILDPHGNPAGVVTIPADVLIRVVSRAAVWGTQENPAGGYDMVRFHLTWP